MRFNIDEYCCPICKSTELQAGSKGVLCTECHVTFPESGGRIDFRYVERAAVESDGMNVDDEYEPEDPALWVRKYGSAQASADRLVGLIREQKERMGRVSLLDVGMYMYGEGAFKPFVEEARPSVDRYVGIDPSGASFMSEDRDNPSDDIVQAFGEYLPLREGSFDLAISVATFDHLFDPEKCLEELRRVLRPGGYLYVQLNNDGAWFKRLFKKHAAERRELARVHHNNFWSPGQFRELLAHHGFRVERMRGYRYNPAWDNPSVGRKVPYQVHVATCNVVDNLGNLLAPGLGGNFGILARLAGSE